MVLIHPAIFLGTNREKKLTAPSLVVLSWPHLGMLVIMIDLASICNGSYAVRVDDVEN